MSERVIIECCFCGGNHATPVGEPGTFLAGIPIGACPKLPEGAVYIDGKYERGPDGALFFIESEGTE